MVWKEERSFFSEHCLSWLTRAPQLLLRPCLSTGLDLPLLLAVKPQQTSAPGLKDLGLGHKSNWSPAHSVIWSTGSSDLAWSPGGRQGRGCGSSWPHPRGGCSECLSVSRAAHEWLQRDRSRDGLCPKLLAPVQNWVSAFCQISAGLGWNCHTRLPTRRTPAGRVTQPHN